MRAPGEPRRTHERRTGGGSALAALLFLSLAGDPAGAQPEIARPEGCAARLAAAGVIVEAAEAKTADAACAVAEPVRLVSVRDAGDARRGIRFPDRPVLSCAMAERFGRFVAEIAAPLALGVHGKELAAVSTGPGFECRPRNRVAGAKFSSHARGEAVDIMSFALHGGLVVSVKEPRDAEAARFVAAVRAAGCGAFSTVLGPGSDAAHGDHLHFDIEARGRDGRSKFCQ